MVEIIIYINYFHHIFLSKEGGKMKRKTLRLIACVIMAAMLVALFAGNVFASTITES